MPRAQRVWTIVVGGGSGRRFGRAKQYELLDDARVIDHATITAATCGDGVVLVVPADDVDAERDRMSSASSVSASVSSSPVIVVAGGATRSDSVRAGLIAVPDDVDIVCVHDAARPLASIAVFERVVAAVAGGADAAIPAIAVSDTIKVVADGHVVETPERSTLVAVQTPQAFRRDVLVDAHARGTDATDDAGLVEAAGGRVAVVEGEADNRKITTPDDLAWARSKVATS